MTDPERPHHQMQSCFPSVRFRAARVPSSMTIPSVSDAGDVPKYVRWTFWCLPPERDVIRWLCFRANVITAEAVSWNVPCPARIRLVHPLMNQAKFVPVRSGKKNIEKRAAAKGGDGYAPCLQAGGRAACPAIPVTLLKFLFLHDSHADQKGDCENGRRCERSGR